MKSSQQAVEMDLRQRFDRCILATRDVMGEAAARDLCMNAVVGSRRRVGEKTRRQNRSNSGSTSRNSARRSIRRRRVTRRTNSS